jgi:hypothetical protein
MDLSKFTLVSAELVSAKTLSLSPLPAPAPSYLGVVFVTTLVAKFKFNFDIIFDFNCLQTLNCAKTTKKIRVLAGFK